MGQPVVKAGVFDGQGQDEASEEHEVGRLQVVDAHFGLKKSFFIKLCLLSKFFLAQLSLFFIFCGTIFPFSWCTDAILERLVLKKRLFNPFFLAQIRYFYLLCYNFSSFKVRRNRTIFEQQVLLKKSPTTLYPR